jgi:polypeptide N-acetylgalactosaminyltransferase
LLSSAGEIRRDEGCLDYSGGIKDANKDDTVIVLACHGQKGNQRWIYNEVCLIVFF